MKVIPFPDSVRNDTYRIVTKNGDEYEIEAFSVIPGDTQEVIMFAKHSGVISMVIHTEELAYAYVVNEEDGENDE